MTLHGEILNLTNHHNMRFVGLEYVPPVDGQQQEAPTQVRTLGFTPAAGVDFQF